MTVGLLRLDLRGDLAGIATCFQGSLGLILICTELAKKIVVLRKSPFDLVITIVRISDRGEAFNCGPQLLEVLALLKQRLRFGKGLLNGLRLDLLSRDYGCPVLAAANQCPRGNYNCN